MNTTQQPKQQGFMQFQIKLVQRVLKLYRVAGEKGSDYRFLSKHAEEIREGWNNGKYSKRQEV
jgi:hypothetical protein